VVTGLDYLWKAWQGRNDQPAGADAQLAGAESADADPQGE